MSDDLVIFGTGAHARKAFHAWTASGGRVRAFADENPRAQSPVGGVPVVDAEKLAALPPGKVFVAIGRPDVRRRLMEQQEARGWELANVVHPKASVAPDAVLEPGVIVAAGAVVESGAVIGRGAIVDVGVIVDHDCRVAAYAHLKPGQVCPSGTNWPA